MPYSPRGPWLCRYDLPSASPLELSTNILTQETPEAVPRIGEEEPVDVLEADDLVRPDAVARFVAFWIIGPSASAGLAYVFFLAVPI